MREILIIKPSSLGDIVHGLRVAQSIKEQSPQTRISWVAASRFAPLVQACATVDRVFIFERKGGLMGFLRLVKELRQQTFDVAMDWQGLARSGLMIFFVKAKRKIGRGDYREGAGLFYNEKVDLPPAGKNSHAQNKTKAKRQERFAFRIEN